jgi:serine/threonine protein kinase
MELTKVGDLGVGFESTVSLVREVKSGQLFALKVSKNKKFANREVEIHKDLQHKHIINLIDAFQTPEEVTMVIEFAPRGSLYDLILKCGTIDEVLMSKITYQTTLALDYLHDHGIMHLDIKPDNILISESNQVKLADFGLSVKKASGHSLRSLALLSRSLTLVFFDQVQNLVDRTLTCHLRLSTWINTINRSICGVLGPPSTMPSSERLPLGKTPRTSS